MAVRAADALAGNDVTLVVSSPMERAQQTSAPIAERHELPIEIDPDLIEADNIFEGKRVSVGDGVLKQPKTWRHLYNPFRPSWGEPYDEVAERMHRAIAAAREKARGHEAVLVSHQLPDLDRATRGRGASALARPAQPAVLPRLAHLAHLRRRHPRGHHLHRAVARPARQGEQGRRSLSARMLTRMAAAAAVAAGAAARRLRIVL